MHGLAQKVVYSDALIPDASKKGAPRYSRTLRRLVARMMAKDARERPSVGRILLLHDGKRAHRAAATTPLEQGQMMNTILVTPQLRKLKSCLPEACYSDEEDVKEDHEQQLTPKKQHRRRHSFSSTPSKPRSKPAATEEIVMAPLDELPRQMLPRVRRCVCPVKYRCISTGHSGTRFET